jgi:hypothetical protein
MTTELNVSNINSLPNINELSDKTVNSKNINVATPNYNPNVGESMNGQTMNGQTMNGQTMNGQTMNGQTMNGQTMNGQSMNGQSMNGQTMNGQSMNGQTMNVNQFVNDIQTASKSGVLSLPSRDIPINQTNITNDQNIQEKYIPQTDNNDYISEYQTNEDIIKKNEYNNNSDNTLDNLYNEASLPLLVGLLYFLFQLPVIRNYIYKIFPMCYTVSGNFNMMGYVLNSLIFSILYYLLKKLINFN